jgi:regulator of replication initiation timing
MFDDIKNLQGTYQAIKRDHPEVKGVLLDSLEKNHVKALEDLQRKEDSIIKLAKQQDNLLTLSAQQAESLEYVQALADGLKVDKMNLEQTVYNKTAEIRMLKMKLATMAMTVGELGQVLQGELS